MKKLAFYQPFFFGQVAGSGKLGAPVRQTATACNLQLDSHRKSPQYAGFQHFIHFSMRLKTEPVA